MTQNVICTLKETAANSGEKHRRFQRAGNYEEKQNKISKNKIKGEKSKQFK